MQMLENKATSDTWMQCVCRNKNILENISALEQKKKTPLIQIYVDPMLTL